MMINKFFSMAALAIVGAVMASCSSDNNNNEVVTPPQPVKTDKLVTLTASVSLDNSGAGTRALDAGGNKTFAVGDKIAVIYKNKTTGNTVKAESEELTAGGSQATFTVTLDDPDKTQNVTYIYPASMAKDDGTVNYDALNEQNGTLAYISSNLDCCTKSGAWNAGALPELTLENQLAICAFKVKGPLGGVDDRTSTISNMVISVSDGPRTYAITGHDENFIYVAIRPTSSATINFYASDGTKYYAKYLEGKTYAAGHMYELGLKMAEVIKGKFSVSSTKQVYFSKGNLQATTTDLGNHWTWKFAEHQWDKIGGRTKNDQNVESGEYTCNNYITGTNKPTVSANGTVDLFGWSTSKTYLGISNYSDNSNYEGDFVEWGTHDDVIDGIGTGWSTLTGQEWAYLLNVTDDKSKYRQGNRFAKAEVNGVYGLILLPDNWETKYYNLENINVTSLSVNATGNDISEDNWKNKLEAHGAVFLPLAGQRRVDNHTVDYPNGRGYYWTSTPTSSEISGYTGQAQRMYVDGNGVSPSVNSSRRFGYAVRLVYPIK